MAEKSYDFDFRWRDAAGEVIADETAIAVDSPLWENVAERIRPLVADGSLKASVGFVTASAKIEDAGKKVEKSAITSYVRITTQTPKAALFLMEDRMLGDANGPGVLTRFDYAYDLDARGSVRNPLLQKLEGPEKAIERAVKGLMGMGMSEEKARKIVADNPPE
jgi:hypothetical protein